MPDLLNAILCRITDLFFLPFRNMNPWGGLSAAALLTAAAVLLAYRFASNQRAIRDAKDRIKAQLMEVRLYLDDPRVVLRAQGRLLAQNFRYLGHSLTPLLVLGIPLALLLVQIDSRFGYRPLAPGETTLLKAEFRAGTNPSDVRISLESQPGVAVETPPLRINAAREAAWRLRADAPGRHRLVLKAHDETHTMDVLVGGGILALPASRHRGGSVALWKASCETLLPEASVLEAIEVQYPSSRVRLAGWEFHWLVAYIVLSILFALALRRPLRAEI